MTPAQMQRAQELLDGGELDPAIAKRLEAKLSGAREEFTQGERSRVHSLGATNPNSLVAPGGASGVEGIRQAEEKRGIYEPSREVDPLEVERAQRERGRTDASISSTSLDRVALTPQEAAEEATTKLYIPNFTGSPDVPPPELGGADFFGRVPLLGQAVWEEPSAEAFKQARPDAIAAIRRQYPELTDEELKNTNAYGEFADQQWTNAYNTAKSRGEGIVRRSFAKQDSFTVQSLAPVLDTIGAAALGGLGGATMGLVPEMMGLAGGSTDQMREAQNQNALAYGGGEFLGAMRGGPMMMARKLGNVLNLAKEGQGAVKSAAKSSIMGGALGGAEMGTKSLGRSTADLIRGKELKENWLQNVARAGEDAAKDAAHGVLFGAGFGAGFDLLGSGILAGAKKLAQGEGIKTKITAMFDADMRPKLTGTETPARAKEMGKLAPDVAVESQAERRLAEPLKRGVRQLEEELKPYKAALDDYERRHANHTVNADNAVKALVVGIKQERDRAGKPLPEIIPQSVRDKVAKDFFDVRHNPDPAETRKLLQAGWTRLSGQTEKGKLLMPFLQPKKGLTFENKKLVNKGLVKTDKKGQVIASRVSPMVEKVEIPIEVYYKPRAMNPTDMQKVIRALDDRSGYAKGGGELSQETLKALDRGLRKDRDLFPQDESGIRAMVGDVEVGGYSALNRVYSDAAGNLKNIKQQIGIGEGPVRLKDLFAGKGEKFDKGARQVEITDQESSAIRNYVIQSITDTGETARKNLNQVAQAADRVAGTFGVQDDLRMFRGLLAEKGLQNVINPSLVMGAGPSPFGISRGFLHPEGLRAKGAGILRNMGSFPRRLGDKPSVVRMIRETLKQNKVPPSLKAVARVLIEARKMAKQHTQGLQAEGANREARNYAMPLSPLSQPGPFVGGDMSMRGGLTAGAGVGATASSPSPDPSDDTVELAGVLYDMVSGGEERAAPSDKQDKSPEPEPEPEEAFQ